jgi:hypothetical protein
MRSRTAALQLSANYLLAFVGLGNGSNKLRSAPIPDNSLGWLAAGIEFPVPIGIIRKES